MCCLPNTQRIITANISTALRYLGNISYKPYVRTMQVVNQLQAQAGHCF